MSITTNIRVRYSSGIPGVEAFEWNDNHFECENLYRILKVYTSTTTYGRLESLVVLSPFGGEVTLVFKREDGKIIHRWWQADGDIYEEVLEHVA